MSNVTLITGDQAVVARDIGKRLGVDDIIAEATHEDAVVRANIAPESAVMGTDTQMQLSQQLSFSLLDRFKEAQQVLIPAWQYHVKQSQTKHSTSDLEKLDNSRESLIKTLKKSLEKPSKT